MCLLIDDLKQPASLATALDQWALRREKVLALLDLRAAKVARKLANRCRVLAEMEGAPLLGESWHTEWNRVHMAGVAMLTSEELVEAPVTTDDAPPDSERPTRAFDFSAFEAEDDRPTRAVFVDIAQVLARAS